MTTVDEVRHALDMLNWEYTENEQFLCFIHCNDEIIVNKENNTVHANNTTYTLDELLDTLRD